MELKTQLNPYDLSWASTEAAGQPGQSPVNLVTVLLVSLVALSLVDVSRCLPGDAPGTPHGNYPHGDYVTVHTTACTN